MCLKKRKKSKWNTVKKNEQCKSCEDKNWLNLDRIRKDQGVILSVSWMWIASVGSIVLGKGKKAT